MEMFIPTFVVVFIIIFSSESYQKSSPTSTFYTAAVVEYSPVSEVGNDGMHGLVAQNVQNYIVFIEDAARQGADIIVFPEVGLTSYGKSMYASLIPDPHDHANPCTNNSAGMLEEITRLSCAAKNNDIYVVINFPEVKICDEMVPGSDCVHNGTFYYNTDIVFDRKGFVVGRYRKYNLFLEPEFNKTPTPEMSIFKTDFGVRFGMFTCFDIIFKAPAVLLVQQFNVTDVIVPQAWFSELPFFTALQSQSQWAYAMDVNLLAAGYSKPSVGSTGSGIYNGQNGPLVTLFSNLNTSRLLLANVPKKVTRSEDHPAHRNVDGNSLPVQESSHEYLQNDSSDSNRQESNSVTSEYTSIGECASNEENHLGNGEILEGLYIMKENLSAYTTLLLDTAKLNGLQKKNVSVQLCSDNLCCNFTVRTSVQPSEGGPAGEINHYRMVVYSGMRSFAGAAYAGIQVCSIVSCTSKCPSTCGLSPSRENTFWPTFNHITITGNFNASNAVQMPNAIAVDFKIINPRLYFYTKNMIEGTKVNVTLQSKKRIGNLLTFGIIGRYFDNDVLQKDARNLHFNFLSTENHNIAT